jgi:SAM-dependent methyltransferase
VTGLDVAVPPLAGTSRASLRAIPAGEGLVRREQGAATPTDFDSYGHSYLDEVQQSVAFVGQDLDFFSEVKARYLVEVATEKLGLLSGRTALDVGCGLGLAHKFLTARFASLHGVDVSDEMVARAAQLNPSVSYRSYAGTALPYRDQSFDLLFAINVLHHVPGAARRDFVHELARVTRPDGLLVIFEHNPLNPLTRLAVRRCRFDVDCALLRPSATLRLLAENGFVPTLSRHILFFPWRGNVFASLDRRLGAIPLGAQYLAAARPAVSLINRQIPTAPSTASGRQAAEH